MKAVAGLSNALKASSLAIAARSLATSAAAQPAATSAAVQQSLTLRDLLPPKPRKVVKRGTRRLPSIRPQDAPYVADHKVQRATTVAPPGTSLASVTVLGKPLRPDLAHGVRAEADSDGAGAAAGVAHRFEDSTTASSASSGVSSGPSSSSSSSSGSDSEGAVSRTTTSATDNSSNSTSRRAPAALDDAPDAAAVTAQPSFGVDANRSFAVIGLGGTQYKVTPGDVINAERIKGVEVGQTLTLTDVRVVGTAARTVLGRPTVPGAAVRCVVEEHALDRKVVVYKKRRRKRYQRTAGHRRMVTRLRVQEVACDLDAF